MKKSAPISVEEREFHFNGFRYAAQYWPAITTTNRHYSEQPVIALHGWLDNSASFDLLAPILSRDSHANVLAPDLAGHGKSDHRNGFSDYPIWSEILAILAMADAFAWQEFTLVGHSRGAMIAMMLASLYPERVSKLVLIDAVGPSPAIATESPIKMLKSLQEMQRRVKRKKSCYPSFDAAIEARTKSEVTRVNISTAKRLAVRGLSELEQGFHWHADDKLWAFGHLPLTPEQIVAFAKNVSSPTLILMANKGLKAFLKDSPDALRLTKQLIEQLKANVKDFEDGHYLHMELSAQDVGREISNFILDPLKTGNKQL